jgi:hypothetical protein
MVPSAILPLLSGSSDVRFGAQSVAPQMVANLERAPSPLENDVTADDFVGPIQ